MSFPDFSDQASRITLCDPLADFLSFITCGLVSYGYADAVQLSGQSGQTVASAYWLGVRAIKTLSGDGQTGRAQALMQTQESGWRSPS
jgi:hypothetical protein